MRRLFFLAFGLLALVLVARPAAAQYKWTGGYIGINAGGAWGHTDTSTRTEFSPAGYFLAEDVILIGSTGRGSMSPGGFTGGAQGGFNWQIGSWVLGLETDFGYLGQDDSRKAGPIEYPSNAGTFFSIKQRVKTDNLFTLRPRVGWAANNWLFYVTSGLAVSSLKTSFNFSDTFSAAAASGSKTAIKPGWTVGTGVEFGLTPNWTVRGEYLYVNFNDVSLKSTNLTAFGGLPVPSNPFFHKADLSSNIVRVAINFKF